MLCSNEQLLYQFNCFSLALIIHVNLSDICGLVYQIFRKVLLKIFMKGMLQSFSILASFSKEVAGTILQKPSDIIYLNYILHLEIRISLLFILFSLRTYTIQMF